MVKRSRHWEMRFESVVVGGIRSEYGTIVGSIPTLITGRLFTLLPFVS
jgi:hypothetical protein